MIGNRSLSALLCILLLFVVIGCRNDDCERAGWGVDGSAAGGPPTLSSLREDDRYRESPEITLFPDKRHQTIDAWSVFAGRYWQHDKKNNRFDRSYEAAVPAVTEFLADRLGINGVVITLASGMENPTDHWMRFYEGLDSYQENKKYRYEKINDNGDPYQADPQGFHFSRLDDRMTKAILPFLRQVEANGETPYVRVQYVDFKVGTNQGTLSHADHPEEFAEFVLAGFQHLQSEHGIVPDSFEVILEPENTIGWRAEEIGRGLVAVKKRLNDNGFHPEFVAPSVASLNHAAEYFDRMIAVPGAASALDVISYHRYGGETIENLQKVRERARRHGLKTAMLEKGGAGFDQLWQDLTVADVSEWMQWAAAWHEGPGTAGWTYAIVDMEDPHDPKVAMSCGYANLAQVFRYVRRGAVRIEADSDDDDYRAMAFVNVNGAYVTIIDAKRGGPIGVSGLPGGTYTVTFMDESERASEGTPSTISSGQTLWVDLPTAGVATLHSP